MFFVLTLLNSILLDLKVLAAFRFPTTVCSQRPVGEKSGLYMSQPFVGHCIHHVTGEFKGSIFYKVWVRSPSHKRTAFFTAYYRLSTALMP